MSACPQGMTSDEVVDAIGAETDEGRRFDKWMRGQTQGVCDGRQYNYALQEYEPTECADSPHGVVTYAHDVKRYLASRDHGAPDVWD